MIIPCRIRALKNISYGKNLRMGEGETAEVTLYREVTDSPSHYPLLKVEKTNELPINEIFTKKALENAMLRGDFALV